MPLLVFRPDNLSAPVSLSQQLLKVYRQRKVVYGQARARQKTHQSVEAERLREWSEEHGRRGRKR